MSLVIGRWWLVFFLAACGGSQQATQPAPAPATGGQPTSAPAPTRSGPTPVPTPGPNEFVNPVLDLNFPDPDVLKAGDTYYAYATNSGTMNIQTAKSKDLVHWNQLGSALPALPDWARPVGGLTWAPEVTQYGNRYVMYFVSRDDKSDKQCIGVATSDTPDGPFTSPQKQPLICQADEGGSIDPAAFAEEDGTRYLLWKNDGNCCAKDTWLYIQKVSADGLQLEGQPTRLIKQGQSWEGHLIEAPTLWKHDEKYYLFYSANDYAGPSYAVGYAVADQLLGPYQKAAEPLLKTNGGRGIVIGPGGQDVVVAPDGRTWMVYHAWDDHASYRAMYIDELDWEGNRPVVRGPDEVPQPVP